MVFIKILQQYKEKLMEYTQEVLFKVMKMVFLQMVQLKVVIVVLI